MATKKEKQIKTTTSSEVADAVDDLRRARGYEYTSDAARDALREGLSELGYLPGTRLQALLARVTTLLFASSMTLFVLSQFSGAEYSFAALGLFVGCLGSLVTTRLVLPWLQPALAGERTLREVIRNGTR